MNVRSQRLRRVLQVRHLFEEMERCRLQSAHAAVTEVEAALAHQQQAIKMAGAAAASALSCGDRDEWMFAEAQSEVSAGNRAHLAPLLETRRAEVGPATAAYLERRTERRQIEQLIAEAMQQRQRDDERAEQVASDDLSLARYARNRR